MNDREHCLRLGRIVRARRDDIVQRWMERVQQVLDAEQMETFELRNAIPHFLQGLAEILIDGQNPEEASGGLWQDVAQEHAVTRVRQGFDVGEVFREFVLLRNVIDDVAAEEGLDDTATMKLVTQSIDAALRVSVQRYVESRDVEVRRTEAEHVGFVAHELRNPLGTATLGVAQLKDMLPEGDAAARVLAIVERAHERLRTLVDDVLAVQKGRAGEIAPQPVSTTLGAIVHEAIEPNRELARRRGLELEVTVDGDQPMSVDRRLTVSAIHNLVDNAIKYSADGPVEVWSSIGSGCVEVHVRDRCGGLPQEELSALFEPFERGRQKALSVGTGLGLSIVRQAVEAQSGSAHAEPAEGGCHFWIRLPVELREDDGSG